MPLSQLYDIFRTLPRQAEKIDTHQYIRREDRKEGRKQNNKDEAPEGFLFGEDNATVSVIALQAFLYSLIEQDDLSEEAGGGTQERPPQTANPSALASYAYRHGAETAPGYKTTENIKKIGPANHKLHLPEQDRETIRRLLVSLHSLSNKNVGHITLEPADGFLASIEMAVNRHL